LAIASMVLGILWIYWVGSVLALVFGYVALRQIRARDESGHSMAIAGIVLGWAGVAIGVIIAVVFVTVGGFSSGSDRLPNPEHVVAGRSITLPRTLYLANAPGSSVLVTPAQAHQVATTLWQLWETALIHRDTKALTQVVAPGPTLAGELNNCDWPTGSCVDETKPRPIITIESVVPVQRTYPLFFLTQIRTNQYLGEQPAPDKLAPWVELQVLTKTGPSAPWQLNFYTGFDGKSAHVPELSFDEEASGAQDFGNTSSTFNPAPTMTGPTPSSSFLPFLAQYWQSWKVTGGPPPHTVFVNDGGTSGFGKQLAGSRQGAVYNGIEQRYLYQFFPQGGLWEFSAYGGYPMVCGSVTVRLTSTPVDGGPLNQNPDRTNWGMPLAPGQYSKIVTVDTHQACVYVIGNKLDSVGGPTDNAFTVTGAPPH
jgi:hypothetical protein